MADYEPDILKRIRRMKKEQDKALQAQTDAADEAGKEQRRVPRISLDELNRVGADELKKRADAFDTPDDDRPWWQRALDVIDIPRNLVANIIGELAGVDTKNLRRGALGLKSVSFSDILDKLGVENRVAKGILGFVGDVAVDPLTYVSLGASTGLNIGKNAPRVLKSGQAALRQTAKAAATGAGRAAPEVLQALGTSEKAVSRLARIRGGQIARQAAEAGQKLTAEQVAKLAAKDLMAKRGGRLTRILAKRADTSLASTARNIEQAGQVAGFLAKHGEKGRTIARLPFANAGLTLKRGAKAEAYKGVTTNAGKQAAEQMVGQAAVQRSKSALELKAQTAIQRLKDAEAARKATADAMSQKLIAQAKQVGAKVPKSRIARARRKIMAVGAKNIKVRKEMTRNSIDTLEKFGQKAGAEALAAKQQRFAAMTSPEAPAIWKGAVAGRIGKDRGIADTIPSNISRIKQRLFGPGNSPLSRREAGAYQRIGGDAARARDLAEQQLAAIATPTVNRIAAQLKADPKDVMAAIYDIAESRVGVGKFHQTDAIRESLSKGLAGQIMGDADVQKVVQQASDMFERDWQAMQATGLGPDKMKGYVPRPLTEEASKAVQIQNRRNLHNPFDPERVRMLEFSQVDDAGKRIGDPVLLKSSDKEKIAAIKGEGWKQINDYEISARQWNQWAQEGGSSLFPNAYRGGHFEQDLVKAAGSSARQRERLEGMAELKRLIDENSVPMSADLLASPKHPEFGHLAAAIPTGQNKEHLANSPFVKMLEPYLKDRAVPRQIADMIERASEVSLQPEEIKTLLRQTDRTMGLWKGVTLMHPGYTARNIFQNYFGGIMAGANPAAVFRRVHDPDLTRIVKSIDKGEAVAGAIKVRGVAVPAEQVLEDARKLNLVNSGLISEAFDPGFRAKAKHYLVGKGNPLKGWFRLNNQIENRQRLATWLHFIDQGLDPQAAALKTIQAMPDLAHMTLFERNFAKRLFPWYAWLRKNGALQLMYLAEKPAFFAGAPKFSHAVEMMLQGKNAVPANLRPAWMNEGGGIQIMGDQNQGTTFLMGSWLPFEQLTQLLASGVAPSEGAVAALSNMRPGAKALAEFATGQDVFRRRQVAPLTTEQLATTGTLPKAFIGRSGTPLDNLLAVRPLREAFRTADMPSFQAGATRAVLGGALQPVDRERGLKARLVELRDQATKLRSKANRARQVGDPTEERALMVQWMRIMAEIQRLGGGQGVPKATQAMLTGAR